MCILNCISRRAAEHAHAILELAHLARPPDYCPLDLKLVGHATPDHGCIIHLHVQNILFLENQTVLATIAEPGYVCFATFQVKFSADGNFLYTGARKDPDILCWDVRYTSDIVYSLQRDTADTNQRIQFDIEPVGRHLTTGMSDHHTALTSCQCSLAVKGRPPYCVHVSAKRMKPSVPLFTVPLFYCCTVFCFYQSCNMHEKPCKL